MRARAVWPDLKTTLEFKLALSLLLLIAVGFVLVWLVTRRL
jgi:hypothetical protein